MSNFLVDALGNPIANRDVLPYDVSNSLNFPNLETNVTFDKRAKLYDAMGNPVVDYFAAKRAAKEVGMITNNEISGTVTNPGILNQNDKEQILFFESMAGANTIVVFEIPMPDSKDGSVFVIMRSIVSISVSTSRAKMPIIPLGENSVNGFALGNKTVAGSIIKALTFNDEFTQKVQFFTEKSLKERKDKFFYQLGTKTFFDSKTYEISHKHFDSIMKDDLVPFNIHTYSYSEYTGGSHKLLMNSIYGCTLINEGQVQSIENLITENTFTYVAKYAKLGQDVTKEYSHASFQNTETAMSGSKLLSQRKK